MNRPAMIPLNRAAIRQIRKKHQGPAHRRAIFWTAYGAGLIVGLPGFLVAFGGIAVSLIGDAWLSVVERVLTRLECWAYPGMHGTHLMLVPSKLKGEPHGKVS